MKTFFFQTKIKNFTPIITEKFTVKLAQNFIDFSRVSLLRYQVFSKEYKGKKFPIGFDYDKYDKYADHLLILDNSTKEIVGTYRLISGDNFFSANSFYIEDILNLPGKKLELGRACVHKDYRQTTVLNLLFSGIIQYAKLFEAEYLFGCSSVKTTDPKLLMGLYKHLCAEGYVVQDCDIEPYPEYQFLYTFEVDERGKDLLPPLLKLYLRLGARVYGKPGIDQEMNCSDFFTVLKLSESNTRLLKRFEKL